MGKPSTLNELTALTVSDLLVAEQDVGGDVGHLRVQVLIDLIESVIAVQSVGVGQNWTDVTLSRAVDTSYQNTTGKPIMVSVGQAPTVSGADVTSNPTVAFAFEVSLDNSTWVNVAYGGNRYPQSGVQAVVPPGIYYRVRKIGSSATVVNFWSELR